MGTTSRRETERLEALASCRVLDTRSEPEFDAIAKHAARIARVPIALISLVDETRQWFKARVGLPVPETPRDVSFCSHAIEGREPFVVTDARSDERFASNPLVTGEPSIVFYAGWPIVTLDGQALGTLCVIDREPRALDDTQRQALALLAQQVALSLELRRVSAPSPLADSLDQKRGWLETVQLIMHDLGTPLTVVAANTTFVIENAALSEDESGGLRDVLAAVFQIQTMLGDLLDVARAEDLRTGPAVRRHPTDVRALLDELLRNTRGGRAEVVVEGPAQLTASVDANLIRRVMNNLVANAQRYAPAGSKICVAFSREPGSIRISVADRGVGVPDGDKQRIFEKYAQLDGSPARSTYGLGLVFCELAVRAHGGKIWVEDNEPTGAVFHFRIPEPD